MNESTSKPIEILLVEDNPGDVRLMHETLCDAKISNNLNVVTDGEQVMSYLRREGRYSDAPQPDLIMLDLNLPNKDGREVLAEIRNNPALEHIPVVIVTSSEAEDDIRKSYNLNADCYLTKPVTFEHIVKVVQSVEEFGFTIVKLTKQGDGNK
ncbi:MAG: response regulator [Nitrospirae bacterium]|nr:response regulator [Nitrospirota bacterium]